MSSAVFSLQLVHRGKRGRVGCVWGEGREGGGEGVCCAYQKGFEERTGWITQVLNLNSPRKLEPNSDQNTPTRARSTFQAFQDKVPQGSKLSK